MAKRTSVRSVTTGDKTLGDKIRSRRLLANVSQSSLADAIGVSFQQVQKYEKGVNRVSAVRLDQIAAALGESVSHFQNDDAHISKGGLELQSMLTDALNLRICRALSSIDDIGLRRQIVRTIERISGIDED